MSVELRGAVAYVTGAARGIGLATGRLLAKRGAHVFLGDIDASRVRSAAAGLGATGLALDVTDRESFAAFIRAGEAVGPPALLVNNAGIMCTGAFADGDPAVHDRELAVNLGGVMTGMQLVLPQMVANGEGHIVNVASMAGKLTTPGAAVYTASKFGVVALSRAVRAEVARSGVTITTLLPAAVRTDLQAGLDTSLMPVAEPGDVAGAIVESAKHGRAEVAVPRWVGPFGSAFENLPEFVGEAAKRAVGAQRRIVPDNAASRAYQDRVRSS